MAWNYLQFTNNEGKILLLDHHERVALANWCKETGIEKFRINIYGMYFLNKVDYVLAKLTFGPNYAGS